MMRQYFRILAALVILLSLVSLGVSSSGAQASEEKGKSTSPNIAVEGLSANLYEHGRTAGLMVVGVNLALGDAAKGAQVNALMPLLRDRYLQILSRLGATTYHMDKPVNIPELVRLLQQATDKVIGQGVAKVQISNLFTQQL